tara:strand:+ start:1227 stop:2396 length:1170 start_codon:yes stop_codon:yes gene_type:complete
MSYSSLVDRISGESAEVWDIHNEARKRQDRGEDVILLSIGEESDETTPDAIQQEAIESIRRGRHHYTPVVGENHLRDAIARRHQQKTGQKVCKANVGIFPGAQNALFSVCLCLLEHGDEVIVPELYYATYPATVTAGGATLVALESKTECGFQPDPEALAEAVTPQTKVILLNSPNNPTGAVYSKETLGAILDLSRKHQIWVISDEVYSDIAPEGFTPIASLPGSHGQTVTISSLSKSHRMTGWRCGWMVGPEKLTQHLTHLNMCMTYGLPPFVQDAGVAALEKDFETAGQVKSRLDRNRQILREELSAMEGAELFANGGGMFAILDARPLELSSREFCWKLLDQQGVSVLPCDGFGKSGRGLARISLCESETVTREAAQRILSFVHSI